MMRATIVGLALLMSGGGVAFAQGDATRVVDIIDDSAAYAGPIVVEGELIGDYGQRSDGTIWTQLNDDIYVDDPTVLGGSGGSNIGIGVRVPAALLDEIPDPGGYRVRGPVVRLVGEWKHHDPDRGGESYLEVTELTLLSPPFKLQERWAPIPGALGIGLVIVSITMARIRRNSDATG